MFFYKELGLSLPPPNLLFKVSQPEHTSGVFCTHLHICMHMDTGTTQTQRETHTQCAQQRTNLKQISEFLIVLSWYRLSIASSLQTDKVVLDWSNKLMNSRFCRAENSFKSSAVKEDRSESMAANQRELRSWQGLARLVSNLRKQNTKSWISCANKIYT